MNTTPKNGIIHPMIGSRPPGFCWRSALIGLVLVALLAGLILPALNKPREPHAPPYQPKPVRLSFEMIDADLFSLQFTR